MIPLQDYLIYNKIELRMCLSHTLISVPYDTVLQDAQSAINDLTGKLAI